MMLPWLPFFLFVVGTCVGSFVNVLVFRSGFTETNASRSHCMACGAALRWYDLVPVLSFCALSGRCRECGSALSIQYPLVELAVGALFLFSFLILPPVFSFWSIFAFVALLIFLASFTGLVAYDIRHTLVPLPFVYALITAALGASVAQSFSIHSAEPLYDSLLGGAALFGFFMAIVILTRGKGMGSGDAYVAGAIGILLGFFRGIEAVMFGIWAGALSGLVLLFLSSLSRKIRLFESDARVTMKTELPLVPFLAFGTAVALYTDISPLAAAASVVALFSGHS
ncbi:prepilin peptidase [Candidatus Kaiserbacteria bacterium]|nr:prepilin peptidase [Candidatus Kaiserbacteria bacterium]